MPPTNDGGDGGFDKKLGNVATLPFRRPKADSKRLVGDRKAFNARLTELQTRAQAGHKSLLTLAHLKMGRTLGEGNFGRVLVCSPSGTSAPVKLPDFAALKIQKKKVMAKSDKEMGHIRDEKVLGFAMKCPFLALLIDYFQDTKNVYFLMELCNAGELWSIIQASPKTRLQPKVACFWAAQVAMSFEYMHNLDIMFRDLKPENLLVDFKGNMKLTDFGFAKRCSDRSYTMCGTPEYMAPEILQGRGYNHDVDWWAFGILVFEMNWGVPPFEARSQMSLFKKIQTAPARFPGHFSKELKQMIEAFITKNPTDRASCNKFKGMDSIKKIPYFKGIKWDAMYAGKVKSPYNPKAKGPGDVSNFDKYDEQPAKWTGSGADEYGDTFLGF